MNQNDLYEVSFGIGVMSKNTVDACLRFANEERQPLLLIPSRRQVDWDGGYVNGWRTGALASYVRDRSKLVFLQRDHGGPNQGRTPDQGALSLSVDCDHCDIIHVDIWRNVPSHDFRAGCEQTARHLAMCSLMNQQVCYEVGTEEAIYPYSPDQLRELLTFLREKLPSRVFSRILYAVIQTGTSLWEDQNTGTFDPVRRDDMLKVCNEFGLLSKIHNGDYLPASMISGHISSGVSAINIAPEFGRIESECYLERLPGPALDRFAQICRRAGQWTKWISEERAKDSARLVRICGHYVLSDPEFLSAVKPAAGPDIDALVQERMVSRLHQLHILTAPTTFFLDIDGTLITHEPPPYNGSNEYQAKVLPGTVERMKRWKEQGHIIILTTGRSEYKRSATEVQLRRAGIPYDQLVMGVGRGVRVLVNDKKPNGDATVKCFNPARNVGIADIAA